MGRSCDVTLTTPEEVAFATENHYMIGEYLRICGLEVEDWYDIVVFRYMRSVKRWFTEPELHKYKFKTVAFHAMKSAIGHEYEKQARRPRTVSLFETIPGTNNLAYADILVNSENGINKLFA